MDGALPVKSSAQILMLCPLQVPDDLAWWGLDAAVALELWPQGEVLGAL